MSRIPILLDTDPGSDIDDAIALAYLLHQPQCELLGVTTVTGEVLQRAAIMEVICRAAGRPEVPIVAGARDPILYGPGQPICPHFETIQHLPYDKQRKANEAVDFLRKTIRSRPHEITLLTVGPLTNIALLFMVDPEIPFLLKNIYSMAGAFWGYNNHEWNTDCDCSASGIITRMKRPEHYWIGLDATMKCQLKSDEVKAGFVGPTLETILLMTQMWFKNTDHITFHDPLAAACVFNSNICKFDQGTVAIEPTDGLCRFDEGSGNDWAASEVDPKAFFSEFFSVF